MRKKFLLLFLSLPLLAADVRLEWDRNPEPDVNLYRVYVGEASRTYTRIISVGNETSFTVTNLTRGRTYYFAVTAVNEAGLESDYSNEVNVALPDKPSAPRNPRVTIQSAFINWRVRKANTGALTPVLVVPGDEGVTVRAVIKSPAGDVTRTAKIGALGRVELAGKPYAEPHVASADVVSVSVDPDIQTAVYVE